MTNTPESRAHVFVEGNVQDVHFRDNAHETARAHDLTGWIRNLDDGRVEGVFEGSEEDVEAMLEWCRTGPIKAEVEDVEVEEGDPQGDLEDFEKR
ncbi:acylphosphatase [Halalkalicoccus jeotgali]|uniref:acylphosphatase n=1 Tax=Halalkalicoccus jeotgali (strain DSM 18796 / CECT 7217 / JCM 14584 / KCTC 4019 / B3) TaxID=795797 RepID=D8J543_HALJB|nr:acylphosphatase [Halalkalicoccus jeotgali]ADJ13624.1 acylphosphatase [Halalkalicoccus jeotgali B3]ELY33354.1 acylphosphatase [Halalkalicoccus jeotgali B3]